MSIEFKIINEIFGRRAGAAANVLLGIGDDAALTRIPDGCDLVTATDALVEGTHFLAGAPARSVGHRSLAVNLSDLAAMSAQPLWASLALGLPHYDRAWLEEFAEGFFALADRYAVRLIGGDTVRSSNLFAAITVQGFVPQGAGVRRSGARPGDLIFVTGHPGDAAAGRHLMAAQPAPAQSGGHAADSLYRKFCFPEPRLAAGQLLRSAASAMIDLSDGLHADLGRLLAASNAGAILDVTRLPLSAEIRRTFDFHSAIAFALCGGEDYELCFTLPPEKLAVLHGLDEQADCVFTMIGEVSSKGELEWTESGERYTVPTSGFEHFE